MTFAGGYRNTCAHELTFVCLTRKGALQERFAMYYALDVVLQTTQLLSTHTKVTSSLQHISCPQPLNSRRQHVGASSRQVLELRHGMLMHCYMQPYTSCDNECGLSCHSRSNTGTDGRHNHMERRHIWRCCC